MSQGPQLPPGFPGGVAQPPRQGHRQPIRSLGKADPASMRPESILDSLFGHSQVEEFGRLLLSPEIFEDAPPWALEVMNAFRRMSNEVAAHNFALVRRGLITIEEIQEARLHIQKLVDEKFSKVLSELNRGFKQAPAGQPAPGSPDPRVPR